MANSTKDLFNKLNEAVQKLASMERDDDNKDHHTSCPKIQKVLHHQRGRKKFAKYYFPRFVSFGPIHYGEPHLQLGEQYKYLWASMYLQGKDRDSKHQKILENIKNLKDLYTKDALGDFDDNNEKLSVILFVDGCSLLQILLKFDFKKAEDLKIKADLLALLRQDVLLLENQLPFQLLSLLANDDNFVIRAIDKFISRFQRFTSHRPEGQSSRQRFMEEEEEIGERDLNSGGEGNREEIEVRLIHPSPPPHLLHHLRSEMLRGFHPKETKSKHKHRSRTYRNVMELKQAGIRVKRSKPKSPIDISFHSTWFGGRLKLPKIVVDHITAPTYLNLIAYETLPDFQNKHEISSYVEFLDTMIDHPEDVKLLRAAGVLLNRLGSDEEVAKLFNTIAADLKTDASTYAYVTEEIEMHYKKRYKTWLSQAFHMYFRSPWTIIAFLAGFLALFLTAAQTWITFYPPKQ
ncbi:UPF0481 protein At3g47200-like [Prosopis cineraria]|uniref:UPF0481 protein At3g47200-like n=1 Tax=Prosopis cineraria TaxID=364024 RepID=UPI0024105EF2|nr:UPF0481 protein At3g47200-like [Prosopis cineraria]